MRGKEVSKQSPATLPSRVSTVFMNFISCVTSLFLIRESRLRVNAHCVHYFHESRYGPGSLSGLLHLSLGVMQAVLLNLQCPRPRRTSKEVGVCDPGARTVRYVSGHRCPCLHPPSRGATLCPSSPAVRLPCVTWLGLGTSVE